MFLMLCSIYPFVFFNISLSSAYFALRHRDGQSNNALLPTWQTILSIVLNTILFLLYTFMICFGKAVAKSRELFYIRAGVMLFMLAFYMGVTFKTSGVDVHFQYQFPNKFELSCINPSVRCNIGIAMDIFVFIIVFFGIPDAFIRWTYKDF
jgi:hypothetical protein